MSDPTTSEAGAYLDAALAVSGLSIDPAWRSSVLANLQRNAEVARLFLDFPLDDGEEPAPVFAP